MRDLLSPTESPIDSALRRLETALAALEAAARDGAADSAVFAELESSRARERALEAVAGEASAALGRAAIAVRAAIAAEG